MDHSENAIADTRRWLERAVIGLNLCPFAKAVLVKEQVHFAAAAAEDPLEDFERELDALLALTAQERDTTLLVLPQGCEDFYDFIGLVARAERVVRKRKLEGVVQVASFHPRFTFAGVEEDDITNHTNRAPWPTLHLLREESMDRAVAAFPDAASIYETNMETMRRLGPEGWEALDVGAKP
ncbi:DUF1415 domain-containing protein [Ramlibacter sp. G-1-2-2]|uniref:DUF1415 domain-containing protein n=1 Tax=Ramlibacter agri TaxID=2728837 RepID=A0A848HDZ0_9BURK|nr:DUF1415 domain-containing protein [Ramlibacter agri]NML47690.1 DUF1415 domain-containing protein [Ramlibacter agri]